jgi:hypothetical protein
VEVLQVGQWKVIGWGIYIVYDVDNDKYMGIARNQGAWYAASLGGTATANSSFRLWLG